MKGERNKREKTNQIKDPVSQHDLNILNSTRIKPDVMTSAETPHHNNSMTAPQTEAAGKGTSCAPSRLRRTQFQPHTYNTTIARQRYLEKNKMFDPCTAPADICISLTSTKSLPELQCGDIYIYLIENPSPYTSQKLKAYKSTDSYLILRSGWVHNAVAWKVKKKSS